MNKHYRGKAFWLFVVTFLLLTGSLAFSKATQARPQLDIIDDNRGGVVERDRESDDNVTSSDTGRSGSVVDTIAPAATFTVTTDIGVDTTWFSGNTYIVNTSLDIWDNATLTIEAGVQVRFNAGMSLDVENTGGLLVNGTSGNPVIFTSNSGSPAPGDW